MLPLDDEAVCSIGVFEEITFYFVALAEQATLAFGTKGYEGLPNTTQVCTPEHLISHVQLHAWPGFPGGSFVGISRRSATSTNITQSRI